MGVVLGLFIGVLNLVPYLQLISLPVATLLCLVWCVSSGGNFWLIFWGGYGCVCGGAMYQDLS